MVTGGDMLSLISSSESSRLNSVRVGGLEAGFAFGLVLGLVNFAFRGVDRRSVIPSHEFAFALDPVALVNGFRCFAFGVSPDSIRLPCADNGSRPRSAGSTVPVETSP